MFEKLGYKEEHHEKETHYVSRHERIKFLLGWKQFVVCNKDDSEGSWAITVGDYLAITQKMKELGWIE